MSGRRLFVDFEGEADGPPVLLGVLGESRALGDSGGFRQYVFDPVLQVAGAASATAHGPCIDETLEGALARLRAACEQEGVELVAWSSYEQSVISGALAASGDLQFWEGRIVDAKAIAKRWKRKVHPDVEFPLTRGSGRHALRHYLDLVGYRVPPTQRGGKTGVRIRAVRTALEKKGSFAALTGVEKRKWLSLLSHNWHDCNGMREVVMRARETENG